VWIENELQGVKDQQKTNEGDAETEEAKNARIEANMEKQEKWLDLQIQLGIELNKPMFFHVRQAHDHFMKVIGKYKDQLRGRCLINCFTGTESELKEYIDMGFYIGVTGFLCNMRRGEDLQKILKHLPLNKVMLGSDAPYLIPFSMEKPFPKWNEPAYLQHVLVLAAQSMGVPYQELAAAATKNTRELFGLPKLAYNGTIHKFTKYSPNACKAIAKVLEKPVQRVVAPVKVDPKAGGDSSAAQGAPADQQEKKNEEKKEEETKQAESENVFIHNGKKYACTPKEKAILDKQKKLLDEKSFMELFNDFSLKEL